MADILITPPIDTNKKAIKDNYVQAITDLETIQTTDFTSGNASQIAAKVDLALKGQAQIIEKLLKFIKNNMIEED